MTQTIQKAQQRSCKKGLEIKLVRLHRLFTVTKTTLYWYPCVPYDTALLVIRMDTSTGMYLTVNCSRMDIIVKIGIITMLCRHATLCHE